MTVVEDQHVALGASFREIDGRRIVADYGRPARTVQAVRNVVGVIEMGYGVVEVTGADRREYVDNAVTNHVPSEEGLGCYALLLDPQGRIQTDMYVYTAADRLLVFTPPERAEPLAAEWAEKTFIQDVELAVRSPEFGVFGVHGPTATENVASVLHGTGTPDDRLSFVRGSIADAGVSVVRGDGLAGEEGYEVVCATDDADAVFDALLSLGSNATPFGARVWETLTLEAGTPLFGTELDGRIPNAAGVRNALDFEKGCYVGQEVVSRIENRGRPPERLVGLTPEEVPDPGETVFIEGEPGGAVTRAVESPTREMPIAFAYVSDLGGRESVSVGQADHGADVVDLPFVSGSEVSARVPLQHP